MISESLEVHNADESFDITNRMTDWDNVPEHEVMSLELTLDLHRAAEREHAVQYASMVTQSNGLIVASLIACVCLAAGLPIEYAMLAAFLSQFFRSMIYYVRTRRAARLTRTTRTNAVTEATDVMEMYPRHGNAE